MNLQAVLEGLLFINGNIGLTAEEIKKILEIDDKKLEQILVNLQNSYLTEDRGIKLEVLGDKFKLVTKKEHKSYYEKLANLDDNFILTQSSLETLAIIAYNEPITRSQIDEIRGVDSSYIVRKLCIQNFIKEIGRSDLPGRPILYSTTSEFLDYFGLSSKEELPKIVDEPSEEEDLFDSKYQES